MKIHSLLLQPALERLKESYEQLSRDSQFDSSEETLNLRSYINRRLEQLNQLFFSLNQSQNQSNAVISPDYAKVYRKLKLDMRFAGRRWQRIVSTEARIRKIHEKGNHHVSTFAA